MALKLRKTAEQARFGPRQLMETAMSTTRDWMLRSADWDRESERTSPPLGGVILWLMSLVVTVFGALAILRLYG